MEYTPETLLGVGLVRGLLRKGSEDGTRAAAAGLYNPRHFAGEENLVSLSLATERCLGGGATPPSSSSAPFRRPLPRDPSLLPAGCHASALLTPLPATGRPGGTRLPHLHLKIREREHLFTWLIV